MTLSGQLAMKHTTPVGAQPVASIPAPQVAAAPQNDPLPFGAPAADANEETPF